MSTPSHVDTNSSSPIANPDDQLPLTTNTQERDFIELNSGDILFQQGDEADGAYVLTAGTLGVRLRHEDGTESEIDRLSPGAIVGEMAIISRVVP